MCVGLMVPVTSAVALPVNAVASALKAKPVTPLCPVPPSVPHVRCRKAAPTPHLFYRIIVDEMTGRHAKPEG